MPPADDADYDAGSEDLYTHKNTYDIYILLLPLLLACCYCCHCCCGYRRGPCECDAAAVVVDVAAVVVVAGTAVAVTADAIC